MNRNGLLLWVISGIGVLFVYSALKNVTPASVITSQLGTSPGRVAINPDSPLPPTPVTIIDSSTGDATLDGDVDELTAISKGRGGYRKSPATFIKTGLLR